MTEWKRADLAGLMKRLKDLAAGLREAADQADKDIEKRIEVMKEQALKVVPQSEEKHG